MLSDRETGSRFQLVTNWIATETLASGLRLTEETIRDLLTFTRAKWRLHWKEHSRITSRPRKAVVVEMNLEGWIGTEWTEERRDIPGWGDRIDMRWSERTAVCREVHLWGETENPGCHERWILQREGAHSSRSIITSPGESISVHSAQTKGQFPPSSAQWTNEFY